jgi:hypothetical protein
MAKVKKISDAEAEVIKDAIVDALENNDEVVQENNDEVAQEVPLNPETEVVPDVTPAGYGSRDFHNPI